MPQWGVDTPAVAAGLDAVDTEQLQRLEFETTKYVLQTQTGKRQYQALLERSCRLLLHSKQLLLKAAGAPRSPAQQRALKRAVTLDHLMAVLVAPRRSGCSKQNRLAMLWSGNIKLLVQHAMAAAAVKRVPRRGDMTAEQRDTRIQDLLEERGGKRPAMRLVSPGPRAVHNDACYAEMRAKHPPAAQGESDADLAALADAWEAERAAAGPDADAQARRAPSCQAADMESIIQKQSPFSSAGPSGLRFSHLQGVLDTRIGRRDLPRTLAALGKLIMLEPAKLSDLYWRLVSGARCVPLATALPDGGVKNRPVAIGETMLQLAASCFLGDNTHDLAAVLIAGGQYAVCLPDGAAQIAAHAKLNHEQGFGLLSLDIKNAFNTASLRATFEAVKTVMPSLLPFFIARYMRNRGNLMFRHDDGSLRCFRAGKGFGQGCPLSPAYYSLLAHAPIQRFNERAAAEQDTMRMTAFADDTQVLLGQGDFTQALFDNLLQFKLDLSERGLELQIPKSRALPGRGHTISQADRLRLAQHEIPLAGGVQDGPDRGLLVVSVAIGHPDFVRAFMQQKLGHAGETARAAEAVLRTVRSERAQLVLILDCVNTVPVYFSRTTDPQLSTQALTEHDSCMQYCVERIMGLLPKDRTWAQHYDNLQHGAASPLQGTQLTQMRGPCRHGGFGMRATAEAAYAGSWSQTLQPVLQSIDTMSPIHSARIADGSLSGLPCIAAVIISVTSLRARLGPSFPQDSVPGAIATHQLELADNPDAALDMQALMHGDAVSGAQRKLTRALEQKQLDDLLAAVEAEQPAERRLSRARLNSVLANGSIATAFLLARFTLCTRYFGGLLFQMALRRLLGIEEVTESCHRCAVQPGGTRHARVCWGRDMRGNATSAHNGVVRAWLRIIAQCLGVTAQRETSEPFVGGEVATNSRMDLYLPAGSFPTVGQTNATFAKGVMLDVSIFDEHASSHVVRAAVDPSGLCTQREEEKREHYARTFDPQQHVLICGAVGAYGIMGKHHRQFLDAVADCGAVGAYGIMGKHHRQFLDAVADEAVARGGFLTDAEGFATVAARYKSSVVANTRAQLSIALQAGMSSKVVKYLSRQVPGHGAPGAAPGIAEEAEVEAVVVAEF